MDQTFWKGCRRTLTGQNAVMPPLSRFAAFSAALLLPCLQIIVERCEAGVRDPLRDALDLFVDAVAIFVRLLVILLRNAQEKERRREEKERAAGRPRGMRTSRL